MKNNTFAVILLCLALMCCTFTPPKPRQIQNLFPIDKPFEAVWQSVIETFADLNLPIMNMEKASGLITSDRINLLDWITFGGQKDLDFCDCGEAGIVYVLQDAFGQLNVYVKKIDENLCEIKIHSVFELNYRIYGNETIYRRACVSTGNLEAEIYKRVLEKIKWSRQRGLCGHSIEASVEPEPKSWPPE